MNTWFKSGKPWIWLTAGSVSISLIAVIGLVLMIGWRGLSFSGLQLFTKCLLNRLTVQRVR